MHILVHDGGIRNVDNEADAGALLALGARELTATEIAEAGMAGFEHLVSPLNTSVGPDGRITFSPPAGPTLAEARTAALARLDAAFADAEAGGRVLSSAGFVIDATERSNRDIAGLITSMEASGTPETTFCAADNSFHTVTLEQLRAMRLEVIAHGQALYARKWELRTAIESAQNVEAVRAIDINFDGVSAA